MAVTLSHYSALDAIRTLRMKAADIAQMDRIALRKPVPWVGKQWSIRAFSNEYWKWAGPSKRKPLHVIVPSMSSKVRMDTVVSHVCANPLPPESIIWLDENTSMVGPELLFLQMASELSLTELVLLGHELCGYFSLPSDAEKGKDAQTQIPAATSVQLLEEYVQKRKHAWGVGKVREALPYIADHAASFPEAVLSTIYALPSSHHGYGLGPVMINQRIKINDEESDKARYRFPDLLFSFAPVGINYDGEDHLDLKGIVAATRSMEAAEGEERAERLRDLHAKLKEVRSKVVDDALRNQELASRGIIVFPMTKENLYGEGNLDEFTLRMLECAQTVFGADVDDAKKVILDSRMADERYDLLCSLLSKA